jgi:hypothetical protein
MSPEEVRLLMKGWLESQSKLMVVGQLWGCAFVVHCRVAVVSESTVGLETDGGKIMVNISKPGTGFKYAQPREFPDLATKKRLTDEQKLSSSLMILFPPREGEEETEENAESISFREIVESQ